jgi:isocitrate dehydrogenase kinase/phosphatase
VKFHLDRESFDQALTGELYYQNRFIQRHRTMHQLVNRATNIDRRMDRLNTWGHAILNAKEHEIAQAESGIRALQASINN